MIDTHCHILPMCDDGPEDWKQSLEMAKEAARQGITAIVATPHHGKGAYSNSQDKINALVKQLNILLESADISVTIYAGQEFHLKEKHDGEYGIDHLRVLGDSKYVLLELPSRKTPKYLFAFLSYLKMNNLVPIIAHPERHLPFIQESRRLYELLVAGVLFQVTAPSLVGYYGLEVQQTAWMMVRNQWVHLLASDAHNLEHREFRLREAYLLLEEGIGREKVNDLLLNADRLVRGGVIDRGRSVIPNPTRRRWNPFSIK